MVSRGVEIILIACTELSIIGHRLETGVKIYDSALILAEAVVEEAKGKN